MGALEHPRMTRSESARDLEARVAEVAAAKLGAKIARFEPLASALGTRRFARVWLDSQAPSTDGVPTTAIARIEYPEDPARRPADTPPEPPLEPIRALLEDEGLPVPQCYAVDDERAVTLLEDLGSLALVDLASSLSKAELESYYTEACDLVPRLQRVAPRVGVAAFERKLDDAHFRYKAERFARWSLGGERGASPGELEVVRDAFARISREAQAAPQRLAHRDLQSANLLVVEKPREKNTTLGARLIMIDLQGAFMAPPEYDLVCLLRDSYVALEDDTVLSHLARVRRALPDQPDDSTFQHRFDLLTLARKGKDHALFLYAAAELGDRRYLRYLPVTRHYLQTAATRVAARDAGFRRFEAVIQSLPEPRCEP
jgi:aminoglycoside/choline kinase family phosphotransferase